jgi:hypothetical protein
MDPAALAAAAISLVGPYLIQLGKEAAKSAAGEAGKSVWAWIKGKLVSPLGAAAVAEAEHAPQEPENMQALQAALTKALKADPDAAKALEEMLQKHGASTSSQTMNFVGDGNIGGQADRQSSVNVNVDRPPASRN